MSDDQAVFIYGRKPVLDFLNLSPDKVDKLYIRDSVRGDQVKELERLASSSKIPLVRVPGRKLQDLVGAVNDQGIVAQISAVTYLELEDWLDQTDVSENPFVVILDEIEDPHNVGAIIRTAVAAGASAVILPKHRQSPVNATVFKTSAGTANRIPIIRIVNTNQCLMKLKDHGFWTGALQMGGRNSIWQQKYDMPFGLVIGGEGKGVRQKTLEHCDFTISIPMVNGVESLNASVSASLVLYEIVRSRQLAHKQSGNKS
ncbi:MAG: 23S rRNA (guanosine(2251)-2'-O)-methyltransferase RlmB [Cyclonatronaceae bacterium]